MPAKTLPDRIVVAGVAAAAEAMFPINDFGAPNFRDTDIVPRTLDYLAALPNTQRRLIKLLFAFVELAAPILCGGFGRFSRMSVPRREAAVRGFRSSRFQLLRLLGDALKATLTMMYMSHPLALAYVGEKPECFSGKRRVRELGAAESGS